ncbi:FtsX-like permease family protein [Paenarthrobacter ilicis]|uniref:ABC transporter permease n=1 Tax=Paenarthrobacter ilicis TaxID=43665 RepID=UPI0028D52AEF|nr:FtsX-like permease family protein [Paenarthrobacter ilicis]
MRRFTFRAGQRPYLTVQSRSAEIALRRAIGSSRWLICRSFIAEGFIVGILLGTATGIVSAIYPAWVASRKDPAIAIRG